MPDEFSDIQKAVREPSQNEQYVQELKKRLAAVNSEIQALEMAQEQNNNQLSEKQRLRASYLAGLDVYEPQTMAAMPERDYDERCPQRY